MIFGLTAHGTGTPVGDALEAEGLRTVFGDRDGEPLYLSSSKTVVGHCHGSAALVGRPSARLSDYSLTVSDI